MEDYSTIIKQKRRERKDLENKIKDLNSQIKPLKRDFYALKTQEYKFISDAAEVHLHDLVTLGFIDFLKTFFNIRYNYNIGWFLAKILQNKGLLNKKYDPKVSFKKYNFYALTLDGLHCQTQTSCDNCYLKFRCWT